jgi:hypothetical protein
MNQTHTLRVVEAISRLLAEYPHWRFGQALSNASMWARGPVENAVDEVTDDELIRAIDDHLKRRSLRQSEQAQPAS